jgi:hypothetical protein
MICIRRGGNHILEHHVRFKPEHPTMPLLLSLSWLLGSVGCWRGKSTLPCLFVLVARERWLMEREEHPTMPLLLSLSWLLGSIG